MQSDLELLQSIWLRVVDAPFDVKEFLQQLRRDGGYDVHSLTDDDFLVMLNESDSDHWKEITFGFSELLTYYAVLDSLTPKQVVAFIYVVIVASELVERRRLSRTGFLTCVLDGLLLTRDQITDGELLIVLKRFVCAS